MAMGLLTQTLASADAGTAGGGLATDSLPPIAGLSPQDFGAATVDGLEYADPTEALSIIDAPVPNNDGSVELSYPLSVPPGHGITPELAVQYGSSGGNGWMGSGWDVSVGEITVDTTFGAPHFVEASESESYLLDGALLTPNANDDVWEPRVDGDRRDFSRQVETEYDEIIRRQVGTGWPADYFWEVRGKDGSVRWYGGTPDSGGPAPSTGPSIDEGAVIRNEAGHIVTWLLSAERDIGVNLIRYEYETIEYQFNGTTWITADCDPANELCGKHTYLDRILYTDATTAIADRNGPPYEIDFVRESEPELGNANVAVRADPIVDAGLGYVDVIVDRLARIEVKHGAAPASGTDRTYDTIAARYGFTYETGRFGKTLLSSIVQGVDDPHVHAIDYYDDLTGTASNVAGFGADTDWTLGRDDVADVTFLDSTADISALGGSETNAGSGNLYIGFNPISPSKTLSFGAGLEFSGGDSEALAEWIDLNGDNLPDKVFLDGNTVKFRLNDTGPGGASSWSSLSTVSGLSGLSENSNFGFQVSAEAYPLVAVGLGMALGLSWSNTYFSDVNGDGLVDFVNGGQVYFNSLNASNIPTFSTSSAGTPIPLDASPLPTISSPELAEFTATLALQSPPIDTVRRFVAPFSGRVSINAQAVLDTVGATSTDGVRVAIQRNGDDETATATLTSSAPSAFADPIELDVTAGDRIYFRVGAIDDGVNDSVTWSPVIEYQDPTWAGTDANGLSQVRFSAEDDFTLAGRPDDFVAMPVAGTAAVDATVITTGALTDAVSVVAVKRNADGVDTRFVLGTVDAGSPADQFTFSEQIPVALTEQPNAEDPSQVNVVPDRLSVYLAVDSAVDVSAIDFSSTITYASVVGGGSNDFEHHVRPSVEIYPGADPAVPVEQTTLSGATDVVLSVKAPSEAAEGIDTVDAVITVKSAEGLEAKVETTLNVAADGTASTTDPVSLGDVGGPAETWVEVTIRDDLFSRNGLTLEKFATVSDDTETTVDNVVLRWSGLQGIFPQAYRGWGIAGYTAGAGLGDVKLNESAFVIDTSTFPEEKEPSRDDVSLDEAQTEPSYAFIPAPESDGGARGEPVATDRWVGPRPSLYGDATTLRTSRLAVDTLDFTSVAPASPGAGTRSAPTRMGKSGPGVTMSFGAGPLGASAALSDSTGTIDFEDLNGDGYPDVIAAGSVVYTNQLGSYLGVRGVARTDVTNRDETISVEGGLSSGMVDIVPNTKGSTNSVDGDAAGKGSSAGDSGPSFSLGLSGSGGYSWTSPNASGGADPGTGTYSTQVASLRSDFSADTDEIQRAFADVNGDGLADSVYTTDTGVFAYYNLGYGFTAHAVKLGSGGFESRESGSGGGGLGFSLPYGEFGGGVNLLWNYDWSTYSWRDVNGDGLLDRLRRESASSIKIAFGTGSGVLAEVDYGDLATVPVSDGIEGGEHVSFDRSSGIGGGASATGYIGPLCLAACYLVIGGGGGYNQSLSSSSADLEDVNGDGFADALLSLNDDRLTVSLNRQGRTNLVRSVTNPLGGSFTVDYERKGNTVDHPDSIWVMDRVDIFDGRSTTGHYASSFDYSGLSYDRAHRSSLGFDTVTTTELDTANGDARVRINEQRFLNDNVFVKGLMTTATMFEPEGATGRVDVRGSTVTWGFRVVRGEQPVPAGFDAQDRVTTVPAAGLGDDVHSVAARGWSIAPLIVAHDEYWYDGAPTFQKRTEYVHDGLGNVLVEDDQGAPDDKFDDVRTTVTYSSCQDAGVTVNGCLPAATPRQPLWSPGTCINWASYPTRVAVEGVDGSGSRVLLRERISDVHMCDNGAATVLEELVSNDGGTRRYATTNVTLNQYGDPAIVMAPAGSDGVRYTVRYGYDADRHSDIALVEEFDVREANAADVLANGPTPGNSTAGLTSSATFDPLSGRVDSRTDANGATRRHVYDEHGRIVETSTMATPTSPSTPLITYGYHANDPEYGYAIARHVDTFAGNTPPAPNDAAGGDTTATIDTITFVDGLGRVRQTKRDARLSVAGAPPVNTRQVSDAVDFDALARPIVQYGPTADRGPATTFSPAATNGVQTLTSWFSYDLPESTTEPGNRVTTYDYPWVAINNGPLLALTVATDPEGRVTTVAQDVRDVQRFHIDQPAPRVDQDGNDTEPPPDLTTEYKVNSLGELLQVVDSTGAVTEYEYDLAGRTIRATTPNGGTVRTTYDLAGNQRATVNDAMAAVGERTTYRYRLNRLTAIDHPGVVDDVTYVYGTDNTDGRFSAGRIRHIEDRTRIVDNTYDRNGAMVEQTAVVKRHNWRPSLSGDELDKFTYTTAWSYDDLGRIATVRYPDAKTVSFVPDGTSVATLTSPDQLSGLLESVDREGELVTYRYDSGGLVRGVRGVEEGVRLVNEPIAPDAEGVVTQIPVPRPTTHTYPYLVDRVYDPRLLAVHDEMGNGTVSDYSFDPDTRWLEAKRTTTPGSGLEIQDLAYTYDIVGRPRTYTNDLPLAGRAINGGAVAQSFDYDGFGRLRGASGTFDLKSGEQQRFSYGAQFDAAAPWSVVAKEQHDSLVTTRGKPSTKVDAERTYSFQRDLGTPGGPLRAVTDDRTASDGTTHVYDYVYNANGGVESMLARSTSRNRKPSETNVWDRQFTWTLMNQLTSAKDGSEMRTFAYDDTGALMIQDGNLLDRNGGVVAESGGGPETIFLNAWTTIRSQKIYKHVRDGLDTIATQADSDGTFEDTQLFIHTDVAGSTNIVTDNQGRGFQRHEYFPSGEIWIIDHKEEIRTPFQFGDGYYEDEFDIVLFGARWYDTERELFLSPDPLLAAEPTALIDQPGLGGAYTYAGANPVGNVDPTGLQFFSAHQRVAVKARAQEAFEIDQFVLKITGEGDRAQTKLNTRIKLLKAQARAEAVLEPNPIVKVDLQAGEVSLGLPYGPRKTWAMNGGNAGSQSGPGEGSASSKYTFSDAYDGTDSTGGPNIGSGGTSPGSTTIDIGNDGPDDAGSFGDSEPRDQPSPPARMDQGAPGNDDRRGDS